MITTGSRYIGGGKLFFKSSVSGSTEVEIGEVQEATFNIGVTTKDAFSKDETMKKLVEKVATEINATIKFTTQIRDAKNMALALLGTASTETFAVGALLPDGTTATAITVVPVINAGTTPIVSGQLKFVGDAKGVKKPILLIYEAVITPTGDIGYIVEDFTTLSFEGAVLQTPSGYAKEYTMTVA
ncbi:MAG: hypothetical protein ACEQSQ_00200 [Candidatus Paceibacteria bacterium]